MSTIAVICSEFYREWADNLYNQAKNQLESYQIQAQQALSKSISLSSLNNLESNKDWDFIQDKSALRKRVIANPDSLQKSLKPFIDQIVHLKMERFRVPGAGEIPLAVKWAVESGQAQAVLALGALVRGQTTHYDFLCGFLERALWDLQKTYSLPIVFSVLMVENREQAEERIKKNRGAEGMKSLIQMIQWDNQNKKQK